MSDIRREIPFHVCNGLRLGGSGHLNGPKRKEISTEFESMAEELHQVIC